MIRSSNRGVKFEATGHTPLGDGFVSVPVREFRAALVRGFDHGKVQAGVHVQIASGYTGQTTEVLALAGETAPTERVVGVYLPTYATVSVSITSGGETPGPAPRTSFLLRIEEA